MRLRFDRIKASPVFKEPYRKINDYSLELDKNIKSLEVSIKNILSKSKSEFAEKVAKLDTLSPLKTLTRGYSITEKNGKIIKSKNDLSKDDEINLKFVDGEKQAKIILSNVLVKDEEKKEEVIYEDETLSLLINNLRNVANRQKFNV